MPLDFRGIGGNRAIVNGFVAVAVIVEGKGLADELIMQVLRREDVLNFFLLVRPEDRHQHTDPITLIAVIGERRQGDHGIPAFRRQRFENFASRSFPLIGRFAGCQKSLLRPDFRQPLDPLASHRPWRQLKRQRDEDPGNPPDTVQHAKGKQKLMWATM